MAEDNVFAKDIMALLALGFVLYSLVVLISLQFDRDNTRLPLVSSQEKTSAVGFVVTFQIGAP